MKIALALPPKQTLAQDQYHRTPQCGIGYLAAGLRQDDIDLAVFNSKFQGLNEDHLTDLLLKGRFDVVGFSAMTFEIKAVGRIAEKLKAANKDCLVVVGGCHVNAIAKETMEEFPQFDLACVGEHEDQIATLLRHLHAREYDALEAFDHIVFRRNGDLYHKTLTRRFVKDITTLPWPAYDLFNSTGLTPAYICARGCPFGCSFCQQNSGKALRKRNPTDICDEIDYYSRYFGQTEFVFRDESFTVNKVLATAVCNELIRRGLNTRLKWSCETHSRAADYDLFCLMREAGCYDVNIGIESGSDEILQATNKATTVEIIEHACSLVKKSGITLGGLFILGHPYETKKTMLQTIRLGARLNPDTITFSMMTPFPGTRVFEYARRNEAGLRLLTMDWEKYDNIAGYAMSWDDFSVSTLKMMQAVGIVWYHVRNFRLRQFAGYVRRHAKGIIAYFLSYGRRAQ